MEPPRTGVKPREGSNNFFDTEKIIPGLMDPPLKGLKAPEGANNFFRHGKNYSRANGASSEGFEGSGINSFRHGKNYSGANVASFDGFE